MQLAILDDQHIRVQFDADEDGFTIDGAPFGALQMLAASLALCSGAVAQEYAATSQFHLHDLAIEVRWSYADRPYRVDRITMRLLIGPEVPPSRRQALVRAIEARCPVHNTLSRGTMIETTLEVIGAQQA